MTEEERWHWYDCAMLYEDYQVVVNNVYILKKYGTAVKQIIACIYELFQDSMISEAQEEELYKLADPEEQFNSPSEYLGEYFDELVSSGTELRDWSNPLLDR